MKLILIGCIIGLLVINLIGLTLVIRRYIHNYAIAKVAGIIVVCLPLFFIEHFVGLGSNLTLLWPITTMGSVWLLHKEQKVFRQQLWRHEQVFLLWFAYAALWRFLYPDIHPSSENIPDALYIANYLPGEKLPPMDYWWPQRVFNWYYAFQHYCAALMGRMFGLNVGQCYNLGFCIISALINSCAWSFITAFLQSRWLRALVMCAFVFGGTGITPILMLPGVDSKIHTNEYVGAGLNLIASNRFSGSYDERLTDPEVRKFFDLNPIAGIEPKTEDEKPRELSVERFSYLYFVKDYHPPLSGLLLLMLALACIAQLEKDKNNKPLQALLVVTAPLSIAANIWSFPLQVGLVVSWIVYRHIKKEPPNWYMLIAGGLFSLGGVYPYLLTLASHSTQTQILPVQPIDHTPITKYIAQHWPIILLIILGLFNKKTRGLTLTLSIAFGLMFLGTEFFYLNDLYEGKYQRANATMKWWGWLWDGITVALGTLLLASQQKIIRYIAIISLLSVSLFLAELLLYLNFSYSEMTKEGTWQPTFFRLSGDGVRVRDPGYNDMIDFLNNAPKGIILENQTTGAYNWATTMGVFTQNPTMQGWPAHMFGYRGPTATYAWRTYDMLRSFYDGNKPDALTWLNYQKVKYIVWSVQDNKVEGAFDKINNSISSEFYWSPFYQNGADKAGLWIRK